MSDRTTGLSRRAFVKGSGLLLGAGVSALSVARSAHAAGSDAIRVGLIGCGGRGTGAAQNAMNAGRDVRIVALADIFPDRVETALKHLSKTTPEQLQVPRDRCFVGFDAYRKLIDCGVDAVIIAGASHFHPLHFQAAIAAGKHVFCEKPHGIDVPGVKAMAATCEEAKKKNVNVVSGLCWRYDLGVREAMARVRDGAIGEIVAIHETYITMPYILRERKPGWNEFYYQMQNWYHFNWLCGDQTSQQLIHSLDKASWALGDRPPKVAWGVGGRQVCTNPKYGDCYDHYAVVFEYDNGVRLFGFCRDIPGCYNETSDVIIGTKGRAILPNKPRIEGQTTWHYSGTKPSMYDVEHQEFFDAIRSGKTINNGNYMATSTMLGILAQMVCFTGQQITWEKAMTSKLSFSLDRYDWDAAPAVMPDKNGLYPTAMPGLTKFA